MITKIDRKHSQKKSKSKKSLIPKRDAKTGSIEQCTEEVTITNPEVRNAVKDIIKLLKGLDKISGSPDTSDYYGTDDVNGVGSQEFKANGENGEVGKDDNNSETVFQSSVNENQSLTANRPVRVSHVILKHEDPTFTKVTYETFDPEIVAPPSRSKEARSRVRQREAIRSHALEFPTISSLRTEDKRRDYRHTGPPQSVVKASELRQNLRTSSSIQRPVPKVGAGNLSRDVELVRFNRAAHKAASMKARPANNDYKFVSFKSNIIYKEPNLNIFLPTESRDLSRIESTWNARGASRHDTTTTGGLPENFGAPYFRLDGSLLEDATFTRNPPTVDIHRLVKKAVQEQQLMYMEVTENAKQYRKIHHYHHNEHGKESPRKSRRKLT